MQSLNRARCLAAGLILALAALAGAPAQAASQATTPTPTSSETSTQAPTAAPSTTESASAAPVADCSAVPAPTDPAAAESPSQPVKLIAGTTNGTFPEGIVNQSRGPMACGVGSFYNDGVYHPRISRYPDGTGAIYFYDQLKIYIGGQYVETIPTRACSELNADIAVPESPIDLYGLLQPGWNTVRIEVWNTCGFAGNSDLYLADLSTTHVSPVPPTSTATPSPEPAGPQEPSSPSPVVTSPSPAAVAVPDPPAPVTSPPTAAPAPETVPFVPPTPSVAAAPKKAVPSTHEKCGSAMFFGVRGSGEKITDFHGYGETIGVMQGNLQINTPGMKSVAINYRAIAVAPQKFTFSREYVNSVEGGVRTLLRTFRQFIADCPHTYAMLAGYSQGAEVAGIVYGRLSDEERRHIAAVTLYADPRFNPDQTSVDQGTFSHWYQGADAAAWGDLKVTVPAGWEARVHSYCDYGDPVCNYRVRNLPGCNALTAFITCTHVHYADLGYSEMGATWARQMLGVMPPL